MYEKHHVSSRIQISLLSATRANIPQLFLSPRMVSARKSSMVCCIRRNRVPSARCQTGLLSEVEMLQPGRKRTTATVFSEENNN